MNHVLKDICNISLQYELQKAYKINKEDIVFLSLSPDRVIELAKKIYLLPLEYRNILFFHYCFHQTADDIKDVLETKNTKSKLSLIQKMLSSFMKLDTMWISDESMEEACHLALLKYKEEYNAVPQTTKPKYSYRFRRKLKDIHIPLTYSHVLVSIAKNVAIFIIICLISLSTILTISTKAREKVYDWIIHIFPQFSVFVSQETNSNTIQLYDIKIKYIPSDYELVSAHEGIEMLIYKYLTNDDRKLIIKFLLHDNEITDYYDTQNTNIYEFVFRNSKAYTWNANNQTYLRWYQNGIECTIIGELSSEEIFKIAESISE